MVCYCDDCQAFLHYLGRADLLDALGGTDIVQMAPAACRSPAATSASSACALFRKAFTGGMRVAAIHRWATRSVRQSRPSGSSLRCLRTTRRQPTSCSASRLQRSTANTRSAPRWQARGGSSCGWSGARSARSSSGVCAVRAGRIPISTAQQGRQATPLRRCRSEREALRPLCGPHLAAGTAGDNRRDWRQRGGDAVAASIALAGGRAQIPR